MVVVLPPPTRCRYGDQARRAGGGAAVLVQLGGAPAGGDGQLPRRLHRLLLQLALHLPDVLLQRVLRRSGSVTHIYIQIYAFVYTDINNDAHDMVRDFNLEYDGGGGGGGTTTSTTRPSSTCTTAGGLKPSAAHGDGGDAPTN